MDQQEHESIVNESHDPLIRILNYIIVLAVKCLAIAMVIVILWSLVDVIVNVFQNIIESPTSRFNIEKLISTFGSFMAVLIAIEIFLNIVFYLKKDAVHVPLVLSTALTAIARKVIVLDYSVATPLAIFATAAVILAVGLTYWLVTKKSLY